MEKNQPRRGYRYLTVAGIGDHMRGDENLAAAVVTEGKVNLMAARVAHRRVFTHLGIGHRGGMRGVIGNLHAGLHRRQIYRGAGLTDAAADSLLHGSAGEFRRFLKAVFNGPLPHHLVEGDGFVGVYGKAVELRKRSADVACPAF